MNELKKLRGVAYSDFARQVPYRPDTVHVVSGLSGCLVMGGHMYAPLSRFVEPTYAIMRVVVGLLYAFHGAQKLFGVLDGTARPIVSLMGLAGIIESIAGLLVMIGLLGGVAPFVASGQMAFAYFLAHAPRAAGPFRTMANWRWSFAFFSCSSRRAVPACGASTR